MNKSHIWKTLMCLLALSTMFSCTDTIEANEPPALSPVSASGTLPILYITTENSAPVVSKEEYLNAFYWLDPSGKEGIEAIGSEEEPLPMEIRGRGHSSWNSPKKPYKIKLGKKASLLGMPKNKHWALLKPSENTVAGLRLGELMGMAWTPSFRPVEVVLNNDYIGLYFLTETIRIDDNRVNIHEQRDGETDPGLIKGGWLVEVDNYRDQCQITVPENSRWNLTIRYHSPEDLSTAQLDWLTNEFKTINKAIYSADKNDPTWEDFIDVESMARYFIIQEVMDNPDGFHGSFYLQKDLTANAKWVAGPIWDLVCYNREKTDYTFRMKVHYGFTPHWIGEIIQYDSFCKTVGEVWKEVYPNGLNEVFEYIDDVILPLGEAWEKDSKRWNDDPSQTAEVRAERIKRALQRNIEWFNCHLPVSNTAVLSPTVDEHSPVRVYDLQGNLIGAYNDYSAATSRLPKGIYIINGHKIKL